MSTKNLSWVKDMRFTIHTPANLLLQTTQEIVLNQNHKLLQQKNILLDKLDLIYYMFYICNTRNFLVLYSEQRVCCLEACTDFFTLLCLRIPCDLLDARRRTKYRIAIFLIPALRTEQIPNVFRSSCLYPPGKFPQIVGI